MKSSVTRPAVVLVNLGTPDALTVKSVRRFLRDFLSDPRVVEIPRVLWLLILNTFVLTLRPKRVLHAYEVIWSERGSPLRYITQDQVQGLQDRFDAQYGSAGPVVTYAMTYGEPSIADTLAQLYNKGHRRHIILPMYPQYSGSTTGAIYDQVAKFVQGRRALPGISLIDSYFYRPEYIQALAASAQAFWQANGRADHLVFSYHGIPKSYADKGDPYPGHCACTTAAVADVLQLSDDDYTQTYQSRFGKAEWLKPYTEATLVELAERGVKRVDVICPAFAADCLETIEEIAEQDRELFIEHGGESLRLIPCLNASAGHLDALYSILKPHVDAAISPNAPS